MRCIHWLCIAKVVDHPPYCFLLVYMKFDTMSLSRFLDSSLSVAFAELDAGMDLLPVLPFTPGLEAVSAGLLCSSVVYGVGLFSSSPGECKFFA